VLPEKSVLDQLSFRVQVVYDGVRIPVKASSKHSHLKVLASLFKALDGVRADSEASLDPLFGLRGINVYPNVRHKLILRVWIFFYQFISLAMDEGLIKVEDKQLFKAHLLETEGNGLVLIQWRLLHHLLDHIQRMEYMVGHLLVN